MNVFKNGEPIPILCIQSVPFFSLMYILIKSQAASGFLEVLAIPRFHALSQVVPLPGMDERAHLPTTFDFAGLSADALIKLGQPITTAAFPLRKT